MLLGSTVPLKALRITVPAIVLKALAFMAGLEFMTFNPLVGSVVAGAIFVMGFVLAGVISDYKEAEKMPGELRSVLDRIWTEARLLHMSKPEFDVEQVRLRLLKILRSFIEGVEQKRGYSGLEPCVESVEGLSDTIAEMEKVGAAPIAISRVKDGRENLLKNILRIYYMQRTVYLPSARILSEVLMLGVILMLIFVKSQSLVETLLMFSVITYFIVYLRYLTYTLDTPFRQGERTQDDVSLFLLKEFEKKLAKPEAKV
ncbi:MAG: hypothetical protein QXH12_03125 [Candidatus Caldarchaeum sp.]